MPFVNANGGEIYFEEDTFYPEWLGQPDVVLLEHGIVRSSAFWRSWVPALAANFKVIRRDMRGHGRSVPPPGKTPWSPGDLVDDLRAFLDCQRLEAVHILGESTGGRIGALFAARYPERVKTLALCSVPVGPYGIFEPLNDESQHSVRNWVESLIREKVLFTDDERKRAWILAQANMITASDLNRIRNLASTIDIGAVADKLTMPTLIIAPVNSERLAPLNESIRLFRSLPRSTLAVVSGRSHEIYSECQQECQSAYLKFVEGNIQ